MTRARRTSATVVEGKPSHFRWELSKAELRREINGALKGVTARVDAMEKGLEHHGNRTLQAVETLTTTCKLRRGQDFRRSSTTRQPGDKGSLHLRARCGTSKPLAAQLQPMTRGVSPP